jgi:hypothetical protein
VGWLLLALVAQWYLTRVLPGGPIILSNATLTSSTGMLYENMTVIIVNGRIDFVGDADREVPVTLGARRLDAQQALVSAATFDPAVASPIDALRHVWVGQIYEGGRGDLVISPVPQGGRGRVRTPSSRELLGAVVKGRYYSLAELTQGR